MAEEQNIVAYDLRQRYADIVGKHLELCAMARLNKDWPGYYDSLVNLHVVVSHKFKGQARGKTKKEVLKEFEDLHTKAINWINQDLRVFQGKQNNPALLNKMTNSLMDIEKYLYSIMEKAGLFGSVASNRSL